MVRLTSPKGTVVHVDDGPLLDRLTRSGYQPDKPPPTKTESEPAKPRRRRKARATTESDN